MRTMMVRILIDVPIEDRATAEKRVADLVFGALKFASDRVWIAVDHPRPQDAAKLWASSAANEDPNRPGHAAIYPTTNKPF